MHIPDGFLDPKVSTGLMGAAALVLGYCLAKVRATVTALAPQEAFASLGKGLSNFKRVLTSAGRQKLYLMGLIGALVYFAQLFDFPVGFGATGHLLGGALAAIVLGPWAGTLAMSAVLLIQAVLLGDGGIMALGANIVTMALVGSFLSYYIFFFLKQHLPNWLTIMITAWSSVFLSALAYSIVAGWRGANEILYAHVVVGLAEALLTLVIVKLIKDQR